LNKVLEGLVAAHFLDDRCVDRVGRKEQAFRHGFGLLDGQGISIAAS